MTSTADQPEIRRPDFLVFSDDWGEHPSSCQHIFRHIAKDHRVLWVNTIGMRNPTFTLRDARKAVRKVSKMVRRQKFRTTAHVPEGNIVVCQPRMIPGTRLSMIREFNARSVTKTVQSLLRDLEFDNPIVVTTVPNAAEYSELLAARKVVYYCVDDFSLWPGLDAEIVRKMESSIIFNADCLIAASGALYERLSVSGKPTYLLTHGVDVPLFSSRVEYEHPKMAHIAKPRVGFFGLIDGRMDWELLVPLAQKMVNTQFVFAGPVDASAGELPKLDNLHFVGAIDYIDLPAFICGVNVLILPYKTDGLSEFLSPLKLNEYLATGKPIVCAPIRAAKDWIDRIQSARTTVEWEELLRRILGTNFTHALTAIPQSLARQSWDAKAKELLSICLRA